MLDRAKTIRNNMPSLMMTIPSAEELYVHLWGLSLCGVPRAIAGARSVEELDRWTEWLRKNLPNNIAEYVIRTQIEPIRKRLEEQERLRRQFLPLLEPILELSSAVELFRKTTVERKSLR